jgi:putative molybdopterin biosynthesis protein
VDQLLFTIPETAAGTRIGRTKIYEEIRDGNLEAIKVGKLTLIPRESIEAYILMKREEAKQRRAAA